MFTTLFRYHFVYNFFSISFSYYFILILFLWRPVGRWVEISAAPFISLWSPIQPQTLPPPPPTKIVTISLFENFYVHDYYLNINDYNLCYSLNLSSPIVMEVCYLCMLAFFMFPIIGWIVFSAKKSGNQCQMSQKGNPRIKFLFFWPQTFFLTFHIYIDLQTNWWNPNVKFFTMAGHFKWDSRKVTWMRRLAHFSQKGGGLWW